MKDLKHIKSFNEHQENLNISDVSSSKINTIKIETSLGIIDIPENVINKNIVYSLYEGAEWFSILNELYDFMSIRTKDDKPGWLFIELSDGAYGSPEYKIIY
jgi:hypothetical protein